MGKEVKESLIQFPIQIRGKRAPIKPDEVQPDENATLKLLPPPLLPLKVNESPLPSLVDSVSANLDQILSATAVGEPSQPSSTPNSRQTPNPLAGSIQELDLFTLSELKINSDSSEQNATENNDPFSSLSLTVQGRIIPCIPCENKSPTGQPPN